MPLPDKVEDLNNISISMTMKQLRSFIGLINYYRDMWNHGSSILTPSLSMTSKQAKWYWNVFDTIKKLVSRESLHFPIQILINQDDKPIAFCSRKLNLAQVIVRIIVHSRESKRVPKYKIRTAN